LFATVRLALITSPTEWQLILGILVLLVLLGAVSLALAWIAQRAWFSDSPRQRRTFWIVASSAMTIGLVSVAVPFYLFIW
jgi:hypothetical protein